MPKATQIAFDFKAPPPPTHIPARPKANEGTLFSVKCSMPLYAQRPVHLYVFAPDERTAMETAKGAYLQCSPITATPYQYGQNQTERANA